MLLSGRPAPAPRKLLQHFNAFKIFEGEKTFSCFYVSVFLKELSRKMKLQSISRFNAAMFYLMQA